DPAALLAQVEQEAALVGDRLGGLAQLRPAVAALAAEHVPGQALAVRPDQGRAPTGRRLGHGPLPVAETESDVLLAVDQALEGHHPRRRGIAVREAQRNGDLLAHLGLVHRYRSSSLVP